MPQVARAALVSEATAYRYFPDLVSLLREALAGVWPARPRRSRRSPTRPTRPSVSPSPAST